MQETTFPNQKYTSIETEELERLRSRIAELEARRVVVPELTDDEIEERFQSTVNPDIDGVDQDKREWCYKDCRWAYNLATSRTSAIPADRVLGEEMVAVEKTSITDLVDAFEILKREEKPGYHDCVDNGVGICAWCLFEERFDAIRANQGGE